MPVELASPHFSVLTANHGCPRVNLDRLLRDHLMFKRVQGRILRPYCYYASDQNGGRYLPVAIGAPRGSGWRGENLGLLLSPGTVIKETRDYERSA